MNHTFQILLGAGDTAPRAAREKARIGACWGMLSGTHGAEGAPERFSAGALYSSFRTRPDGTARLVTGKPVISTRIGHFSPTETITDQVHRTSGDTVIANPNTQVCFDETARPTTIPKGTVPFSNATVGACVSLAHHRIGIRRFGSHATVTPLSSS
jgi:hypothetical protein